MYLQTLNTTKMNAISLDNGNTCENEWEREREYRNWHSSPGHSTFLATTRKTS